MRGGLRAAGWGLAAAAVVAWTVLFTLGGLTARPGDDFDRWVGWANIAGAAFGASALLLMLLGKLAPGPDPSLEAVEDELYRIVLSQAQVARSRLIGPGEPGDQPANVSFARSLRFRGVGGASDGDLASVLDYYRSLSPGRLVVLGKPGAGKTVLALELQVRLLEVRRDEPTAPIPVLISAAAYDTGQSWEAWLAQHLAARFGIRQHTATRLVRDRRILPLVDGLDEMDLTEDGQARDEQARRARVLAGALNAAMRGHERAPVVVTCRRDEYDALAPGIDRATHVEVTGLLADEAAGYLLDHLRTPAEIRRWRPVLASLEGDPYGPLATQLATPWRLTLALAAFRDDGRPEALLPPAGSTEDEYSQYMDTLLLGAYVPAAVHLHSLGTRYTEPRVRRWLIVLAQGLAWQSRHGMSSADIDLCDWWLLAGHRATRNTHVAIAALPAIICLVTAIITRNYSLFWLGYILLIVSGLAAIRPRLWGLSIRGLTRREELAEIIPWLVVGLLVVGPVSGLLGWLAVGPTFGFEFGLRFGLISGLTLGITTGMMVDMPDDRGARGVIRADAGVRLMTALSLGLPAGIAIYLTYGFTAGFVVGPAVGATVGLAGNGAPWVRYHIAVIVAAARGEAPLRLAAFLEWATEAGLLRVSGNTYQFRHRQLQDWLNANAAGKSVSPARGGLGSGAPFCRKPT